MIGAEKDGSCWSQAFELVKEIILEANYVKQKFHKDNAKPDIVADALIEEFGLYDRIHGGDLIVKRV